jgi:hypothetical protein
MALPLSFKSLKASLLMAAVQLSETLLTPTKECIKRLLRFPRKCGTKNDG